MRPFPFARTTGMTCLVALVFVLVAAGQEATRRVEIHLRPDQSPATPLEQLQPLGFLADPQAGAPAPRGVIRGRLPEASLDKTSALNSIRRVVIAPADTPAAGTDNSIHDVRVRYYIDASRKLHVDHFREMVKKLEDLGFKKNPGLPGEEFHDDPISGTAPGSVISKLAAVPYVHTVLVTPPGYTLPAAEQPVFVRLNLTPGFGPALQAEVARKTREMLKPLNFQEAVAHDHQSHRRLLGYLPAGQLELLLLGKTSRAPDARRDLFIEMPVPTGKNPFATKGQIMLDAVVYYRPRVNRDQVEKDLQALGFEFAKDGEGQEGASGYFRGRVSSRLVPFLERVEYVTRVQEDLASGTERIMPIQQIEVIPEPAGEAPKEAAPGEAGARPELEKIAPDLRTLLGEQPADAAGKPVRVEVVLRHTPVPGDDGWFAALAGNMTVEGRIGPLVTGLILPGQLAGLAAVPQVSSIRLPHVARPFVLPPLDPKAPGKLPVDFIVLGTGTEAPAPLASLPKRGAQRAAAVVASDFRGYQQFVGKGLPARTQLLDFTGERYQNLQSEPEGDSGAAIGGGTRLALALMEAAPAGTLYLVRVSPDAPYQIEEVVRSVEGFGWRSQAITTRDAELRAERGRLEEERAKLRARRRLITSNFSDDERSVTTRDEYRKDQEAFNKAELEYGRRMERYLQLAADANLLKKVDTVLVAMPYRDGHPIPPDRTPTLRYLGLGRGNASAALPGATWILAVPRSEGQDWTGLFRDENRDGVLDRKADHSHRSDVRFLLWQPHSWTRPTGSTGPELVFQELPAGAVVQVTVQWQEVHTPAWKKGVDEDHFRKPLIPIALVALRQRDPHGQQLPNDAFDVVGRSSGWVDRLENDDRTAIYQATVRFQVDKPGRYAVRIEGQEPTTSLPPAGGRLPNERRWELKPQVRVDVLDPASREKGHVVLE